MSRDLRTDPHVDLGTPSRPLPARVAPRRCRQARPGLEPMEGRTLLSLSPVAPNAGYPFTAIVELQETFPDHKTYVGSGVMVDSFHVLTAGHVVYSAADGGFASSILAIPELSGSQQPFGSASMTYERTFPAFVNYSQSHPGGTTVPGDYDIGLITLNRNIGSLTGSMSYGYDNNNADFAPGTIYNTAGYPAAGGYDGHHMEFSSGAIAGLSSDGSALQYYQSSITTYGGQSGSPVWRYTPSTNSRVVYGVHVGGSGAANSLNFATRITQPIFNALQSWQAADRNPGTRAVTRAAVVGTSRASVSGGAEGMATAAQALPVARSPRGSPGDHRAATPAQARPVRLPIPSGPRWPVAQPGREWRAWV